MSAPQLSAQGQQPLSILRGVGPALEKKLHERGLHALQDLWVQLPIGFEDRTQLLKFDALHLGQAAQIEARVLSVERGFRFRPSLKILLEDDSFRTLCLRFFHYNNAQANQFQIGRWLRCYGEVRLGANHYEMVHPSYRFITDSERGFCKDRLDPVYSNFEGVGAATLAKLVQQSLLYLPDDQSLELLPETLLADWHLPSLRTALLSIHQPEIGTHLADFQSRQHPAIKRLVLEELLAHHLSLQQKRRLIKAQKAHSIKIQSALKQQFLARLAFQLTSAQQNVDAEIDADLQQAQPMLRLVQGDVGCGKTVVAALAALSVIGSGGQVALMAPTELLAEQHKQTFQAWFEPLGIEVVYLASKLGAKQRRAVLQKITEGVAMVIGTHALMQEHVVYKDLSLVLIDEQHRFGVHQRLRLHDKGVNGAYSPHQLILTATPIPRTLAMAAYADLDVSVIDQLPPGRTPVQTVALANSRREEVLARIALLCSQGRQVYWVCTLIDESEDIQAQSAQAAFDLIQSVLPQLRLALIHSKIANTIKHDIMHAFKRGDIDLLIATTVIEVGVDVPNASLMVIENAERLGLAQLHQLRGRVGRGAVASHCVLLYQAPLSALARQRLDVMRETNNGFIVAEKDLQLRGPGELLGTRQTGEMGYKIADLRLDAELLPGVLRLGNQMMQAYPEQATALVQRWIGDAVRFVHA